MAQSKAKDQSMKQAVKDALHEVLTEEPEFLREILLEAMEDIALAELVLEARKTEKFVPRSAVMKVLKGKK